MKKRSNFLFATGNVAALNYEAAERRFYAAAESVPWDRAPDWARFAYCGSWFLLWLENTPTQVLHDEVVVDGRSQQDPGAIVWPAIGLVKRPEVSA